MRSVGRFPAPASTAPQGPGLVRATAGAVKTRAALLAERVVQAVARNNFEGQSFTLGERLGRRATMVVGAQLGAGAFGVVHRVRLEDASRRFAAEHPALFLEDGRPRRDLVVKFPHQLPVALPGAYDPRVALRQEAQDARSFGAALGADPIPGAEVLYVSEGDPPFLIKPFVEAMSLEELARVQGARLTPMQGDLLRTQIFDKAVVAHERTKEALDIKPTNVAWDASRERWVMYEIARLPGGLATYYTGAGFETYRHIFESVMAARIARCSR